MNFKILNKKKCIGFILLPLQSVMHFLKKINLLSYNYYIKKSFKRCGENFWLADTNALISGSNKIKIGDNFLGQRGIRIEAITKYINEIYNPNIIIKNNVNINDYVHISATNYVEIGNNVLIGSRVLITDHNHGLYSGNIHTPSFEIQSNKVLTNDKSVIIEDNCWIGDGVSVMPGVRIGSNSIIGANSLVNKNIPPDCMAVGIPARIIKRYCFQSKKWEKVNEVNKIHKI